MIIYEVLKALGVIIFLVFFYLGYGRAIEHGKIFNKVLRDKKIYLKKEYHNKSLSKYIRVYYFSPAREETANFFIENKMINTKELRENNLSSFETKKMNHDSI